MGILSNTCSIAQFQIRGELAELDFFAAAPELFNLHRFTSIAETLDEESTGWVHLEDQRKALANFGDCFRERYLFISLRRDTRKVPAAMLKEQLDIACEKWLEDHADYQKVPKSVKEELKKVVKEQLLAKTLPDPKTYDLIWDTQRNVAYFSTLSNKTVELVQEMFKRTFEGMRLVALHPYERAMSVLSNDHQRLLAAANQATSENFLDLIQSNKWIGCDFLAWLMWRTLNSDSEYTVNQNGPAEFGVKFTAYIDDKIVLCRAAEGGTQFISISGPQDHFQEVRRALADRKQIAEATIHIEAEDEKWHLHLKGELFHFASFACPPVRLEKDSTTDEDLEREAVFFERMALIEKGEQIFNSLFATFLRVRLGEEWANTEQQIFAWAAEG